MAEFDNEDGMSMNWWLHVIHREIILLLLMAIELHMQVAAVVTYRADIMDIPDYTAHRTNLFLWILLIYFDYSVIYIVVHRTTPSRIHYSYVIMYFSVHVLFSTIEHRYYTYYGTDILDTLSTIP